MRLTMFGKDQSSLANDSHEFKSTNPDLSLSFTFFHLLSSRLMRLAVAGCDFKAPGRKSNSFSPSSMVLSLVSISIMPCGFTRAALKYFQPTSSASNSYSCEKLCTIRSDDAPLIAPDRLLSLAKINSVNSRGPNEEI